ncbi:Scarecrow-like protein 1 [Ananas comosus]|uniref:Scarecrow-like protein 1 n=1 Tax=Ananas comosus TaxID=4615 RepID=A0A199ULR9_ANACO|nr:Scarecrow-like protein 1 [Ananas comosus]
MSLISSADPSATPYVDSNFYARRNNGDSSGFSRKAFNSDEQFFHYGPDFSGIYSQKYFTGSPTVANVNPLASSPSIDESLFHPIANTQSPAYLDHPDSSLSSDVSHQSSHSLSDHQILENSIDFPEEEMRIKLYELEQVLLNDNDEIEEEHLVIEDDWSEPIKNLMLTNSPKESSSDSSLSCTGEARTPKQLLFDCAAAIAENRIEEAEIIITELRQSVSIQGEPHQRLAAYLVEALAARIASSGRGIYKALKCKEPQGNDRLAAMQVLFEVCPCFKFGFMAANHAILEAIKDEDRLHIIDFDINQASQYITLIQMMQSLMAQRKKPFRMRITGVDDSESVRRAIGGLGIVGKRLEKLAEDCGVLFEFRAVAAKIGDVTPEMLECRRGEAVVVNFAFQLHHMPDESVSTVNERDRLLRMVKGLRPKLVTMVEQDANTNTAPFLPRFVEVYNYYSAVFNSLDATLPRESADRINVEKQCLAREIVNIVACEGTDRIERYEAAGKWRARMTMAGFVSCPFSSNTSGAIRALGKSYYDYFAVKEENGALYFGWEDKILVMASAWK